MAKFQHLRRDNGGAIGLIGVIGKVFLVVILGRPELIKGGHLGDDLSIVYALLRDLVDDLEGGLFLLF